MSGRVLFVLFPLHIWYFYIGELSIKVQLKASVILVGKKSNVVAILMHFIEFWQIIVIIIIIIIIIINIYIAQIPCE